MRAILVLVALAAGYLAGDRLRPEPHRPRVSTVRQDDVQAPAPQFDLTGATFPEPQFGDTERRGRVTDLEGSPLQGVTVRAFLTPPRVEPVEGHGELEASVYRAVAWHRWRRSAQRTAQTGDDGKYVVAGLPAEGVSLSAESPSYRFTAAQDGVDFIGVRLRDCRFDVRLPDGTQPVEAKLLVTSDHRERRLRWTPSNDTFELDRADCDITGTPTRTSSS